MEVARAMKLRFAPTLAFELDASFEHASRIDALLRREDVARDLEPDGADDGA
jgi:ribosome-binding factor A